MKPRAGPSRILLPGLLLALALAARPATGEGDRRPIVYGRGDCFSGTLPVRWAGGGRHPQREWLPVVLQEITERTGLEFVLEPDRRAAADALLISPAAGGPLEFRAMVEAAVREMLFDPKLVRRRPSVFQEVSAAVDADLLLVDAPTYRPGAVELSLRTIEGEEVHPPGPLRPIRLGPETDLEGTFVVLRFRDDSGYREEIRRWLLDLRPDRRPVRCVLEGAREITPGETARFQVIAALGTAPVPGLAVEAEFAGRPARAVTDRAGVARFEFPPLAEAPGEAAPVHATVSGPGVEARLSGVVRFGPPLRTLHLVADRPLARPGGDVQFRAVLADTLSQVGVPGERIRLELSDEKKNRIATLFATTDEFGAAVFRAELPDGGSGWRYHARASGGGAVPLSIEFAVQAIPEPTFLVDIETAPRRDDGRIRGVVRAFTRFGRPVANATASVRATDGRQWGESETIELGDEGEAAFVVKEWRGGGAAFVEVRVKAGKHSVVRTVPLPAAPAPEAEAPEPPPPAAAGTDSEFGFDAPAVAAAGGEIAVGVRRAPGGRPTTVDLVMGGRLLGGATIDPDGDPRAAIAVPAGIAGSAELLVRSPEGEELSHPVEIRAGDLRLEVVPSSAAIRPGGEFGLSVRAAGPDGDGRPVQLSVRVFDGNYRSAAARLPAPLGRSSGSAALFAGLPAVLAVAGPEEVEGRRIRRADRAGRAAFLRARRDAAAGRPPTARTPWGDPFRVERLGDGARLHFDAPVPGGPDSPFAPWPWFTERVAAAPPASPGAFDPLLRPAEPPGARHLRSVTHLRLLPRLDGSFDGGEDARLAIGATGLVLFCLLDGPLPDVGDAERMRRTGAGAAVRRLIAAQGEDGFFGARERPAALLNHVLAATGLAAACRSWGDAEHRAALDRALAALAAVQRADGSFTEAGAETPNLTLSAWAAVLVRLAPDGQPDAVRIREGLARWAAAAVDPAEGRIRSSEEERLGLPFAPPDAATEAAMTVALFERAGLDPASLPKAAETLSTQIDACEDVDLHGLWWARIASWIVDRSAGRSLDRSFHNLCSSAPRADRRTSATVESALYASILAYTYGVYEGCGCPIHPDGGPRAFLRDPAVAEPAIATDDAGRLERTYRLPDAVGSYDVIVDAWDGRGGYAREIRRIEAREVLGVESDVPARLHVGDRVRVPVRVRWNGKEEAVVRVAVQAEGVRVAPATLELKVAPGRLAFGAIEISAEGAGPARITLRAVSGDESDAAVHDLRVEGEESGRVLPWDLEPGSTVRVREALGDLAFFYEGRELTGSVFVAPNAAAVAAEAFEGRSALPPECLDGTIETMATALHTTRTADRAGRGRPDLVERARTALAEGFARLARFEADGGGLALHPGGPADPTATAAVLLLFFGEGPPRGPDPDLLGRAADWLANHLPAPGPERVRALAALRRAGRPAPFDAEPWIAAPDGLHGVALATVFGLVPPEREAAVAAAIEAGLEKLDPGRLYDDAVLESAAYGALALARLRPGSESAAAALGEVMKRRGLSGSWRSSRGTSAALALIAEALPGLPPGVPIVVQMDGEVVAVIEPGSNLAKVPLGPMTLDTRVGVKAMGGGPLFAELRIHGPMTGIGHSLDGVVVDWPECPVRPGAAFDVQIQAVRRRGSAPEALDFFLPLPAGVRTADRAAFLAGAPAVAWLEELPGGLRLCLKAGGEDRTILQLPLMAEFPGELHAAPASPSLSSLEKPARLVVAE